MSAVEISRLNAQIKAITHLIDNSDDFIRGLIEVIKMYSNRAYRLGEEVRMDTLIPSYKLPPVVMQQLESEVSILAKKNPQKALNIAKQLWNKRHLELKLLAVVIISSLPNNLSKTAIQILKSWLEIQEDKNITQAILDKASALFKKESLEKWADVIKTWLENESIEKQKLGIYAICNLIRNESYKNMPRIFKMLKPLFINPLLPLQQGLKDVIYELRNKSETETISFLRMIIQSTKNPSTLLFVRRSITEFSSDIQSDLRNLME